MTLCNIRRSPWLDEAKPSGGALRAGPRALTRESIALTRVASIVLALLGKQYAAVLGHL
jgi:hypothetical protein